MPRKPMARRPLPQRRETELRRRQPPPQTAAPSRGDGLADAPARRIARQLDVDLTLVRGSGPNGLILRSDVLTQAQTRASPPLSPADAATAFPPNAKLTPLRGPAAALSGYMEQSLSIPTATSFRSVPVDVLDARRKELNGARQGGRAQRAHLVHAPDRLRAGARGARASVHHLFVSARRIRRAVRGSSPASISVSPSTPSARTERVRWSFP